MELNSNLSLKAQQDMELVERARSGDQLAYGELLGRYRDAIYFMLLKMVNTVQVLCGALSQSIHRDI